LKFPLQPTGPIVLSANLTGTKSVRGADLLLDTGAEYCSITLRLAHNLGFNLSGPHRNVAIITANGVVRVPSFLIPEIRIGNAYAHHVAVTCQDVPEIPEINGFIGLNFLRRCRTVIDYQKLFIRVARF